MEMSNNKWVLLGGGIDAECDKVNQQPREKKEMVSTNLEKKPSEWGGGTGRKEEEGMTHLHVAS